MSRFITFEGGEGAGKSTLIVSLANALSQNTLTTREPGCTELGEEVRRLLLDRTNPISPLAETLLFLAARAEHIEKVIRPALDAGKLVLCDRYNDSTVAYQGHARGLGMEQTKKLCALATHDLTPDLTFYLDLPPQIGLKRLQHSTDRIESEAMAFHEKVREAFLTIAQDEPERVIVIDATQSKEKVFTDVLEKVREHVIQ